jgi:hypothetical protein
MQSMSLEESKAERGLASPILRSNGGQGRCWNLRFGTSGEGVAEVVWICLACDATQFFAFVSLSVCLRLTVL